MKTRSIVRRALSLFVAVAFVAPTFPMAAPAVAAPVALDNVAITVTVANQTFTHSSASLFTAGSEVDTAGVNTWIANSIAPAVFKPTADATRKLNKKKRRFDFKSPVYGRKLDSASALQTIANELRAEASSGASSTVAVSAVGTSPKVTKFGKVILVSLKLRKISLYNDRKVEKTYRCAIGMPAYPTPTGTFYIGRKVKNPTWNNGGASWAKNMPSYIGPGPSNPLGTRALYLYKKGHGDTGVRFHGTTKDSSIGHAASHGCMRMHRKSVENFYPRVPVGTTVYIIK